MLGQIFSFPIMEIPVILFVIIIAFVVFVLQHLRNNQKDIMSVQQETQEDYDKIVQLVEQISTWMKVPIASCV